MNKRELIEHINNTLFDNLKDTFFYRTYMIILRTSYTNGNNSVSVTSETISKLKKLLMTSEVTE